MLDKDKQEFLIAFGNRVRMLRIKKQMTLDELARKCGYTSDNARSSIQKIEMGKSDIPASKISLIAKALDVPVSIIMGWQDERDFFHNTDQLQHYDTKRFHRETETAIKENYGTSVFEAFSMFVQLDIEDQAEIRGEMKQMLKDEKYIYKKEASDGKVM